MNLNRLPLNCNSTDSLLKYLEVGIAEVSCEMKLLHYEIYIYIQFKQVFLLLFSELVDLLC